MKFAVIGCGSMGTRRIRHVQQLKAGEVLGFNRGPQRRNEAEQQYGIQTVGSARELIHEDPDAVFICVPPAAHLYYMNLAVERGWHFMTEQPVSHTMDGLDALVRAVEQSNLVTHVSSNMRFHQAVRSLKELIEADTIGPILAGFVERGEWLPDWHPHEPYTEYYPARRSKGGGLDFVCELDWLAYLFGPVSRMACLADKKSSLDIDTNDVVQILVEFASGAQVSLHSDMIQRSYSYRAKFIGERGTVEWDWELRRIRLYRAESKRWEIFEEDADAIQLPTMKGKPGWRWVEPMYLEDARVFINKLQDGDTTLSSLKTGIENLRLALKTVQCNSYNQVWQNPELRLV